MKNSSLALAATDLVEVFSTLYGSVYQSDKENRIYLNFSGRKAQYKLACLQRLKRVIDNIDLARMTDVDHPGIEIIFLCGAEECFVLDIHEIINLRELLNGTFAMFELNSIITDRLNRIII
ncbi:hypothetical protein Pedsa_3684 [Pseudopedobacter saltans DSM 12145]|uniref:Uncharacterized protein n=1 Tax=Pseudopedobacter saltans (strain ATCC 51119 / DSM 12145 / JCM 21818 / CCUG 39354 / LMG 10337 / NBRC 100064 / NCIMB 13643) TaxID=762903 RepID=F0S5N9_PSESL|nr:hypothetical protein [Pseudopedobacter saltans]ADY54213.1 hypothetical protein Pedsa_3684 [Pseudopedobacter saltans DSM 12145]